MLLRIPSKIVNDANFASILKKHGVVHHTHTFEVKSIQNLKNFLTEATNRDFVVITREQGEPVPSSEWINSYFVSTFDKIHTFDVVEEANGWFRTTNTALYCLPTDTPEEKKNALRVKLIMDATR